MKKLLSLILATTVIFTAMAFTACKNAEEEAYYIPSQIKCGGKNLTIPDDENGVYFSGYTFKYNKNDLIATICPDESLDDEAYDFDDCDDLYTLEYDKSLRIKAFTARSDTDDTTLNFSYDKNGNVTKSIQSSTNEFSGYYYENYKYDSQNRIIGIDTSEDLKNVEITYSGNKATGKLKEGTFNFEYDKYGNTTKFKTNLKDDADNIEFTVDYEYDQHGNPTKIFYKGKNSLDNVVVTKKFEYTYQRVSKKDYINYRTIKHFFDENHIYTPEYCNYINQKFPFSSLYNVLESLIL